MCIVSTTSDARGDCPLILIRNFDVAFKDDRLVCAVSRPNHAVPRTEAYDPEGGMSLIQWVERMVEVA